MTKEVAKELSSFPEPKVDAMKAQKEDEIERHQKEKEATK